MSSYGSLKDSFIDGALRDSGVWDREFNDRNLLLVEAFVVKPIMLPAEILCEVARQVFTRTCYHMTVYESTAVVIAHVTTVEQDKTDCATFLRGFGFSRIDDTDWFGMLGCLRPDHSARKLQGAQDMDPPSVTTLPSYLEQFERALESRRTLEFKHLKVNDISDQFCGHSDKLVTRVLELRSMQQGSTIFTSHQVKFGCTYSRCHGALTVLACISICSNDQTSSSTVFAHTSGDSHRLYILNNLDQVDDMIEKHIKPCLAMDLEFLYRHNDAAIGLAYPRAGSSVIFIYGHS